MNKYQKSKRDFVSHLAKPGMPAEMSIQQWTVATQYGIPEAHVRQRLIEWASEGLIEISAYNGTRVSSWREWQNLDEMFANRTEHGYAPVSLLAAGGEFVEELPTHAISFVTA